MGASARFRQKVAEIRAELEAKHGELPVSLLERVEDLALGELFAESFVGSLDEAPMREVLLSKRAELERAAATRVPPRPPLELELDEIPEGAAGG